MKKMILTMLFFLATFSGFAQKEIAKTDILYDGTITFKSKAKLDTIVECNSIKAYDTTVLVLNYGRATYNGMVADTNSMPLGVMLMVEVSSDSIKAGKLDSVFVCAFYSPGAGNLTATIQPNNLCMYKGYAHKSLGYTDIYNITNKKAYTDYAKKDAYVLQADFPLHAIVDPGGKLYVKLGTGYTKGDKVKVKIYKIYWIRV